MIMKRTIILLLCLTATLGAWAQKNTKKSDNNKEKKEKTTTTPASEEPTSYKATPSNMWEVGLHGGYLFSTGDVPTTSGYGGGIHLRKALDYIFSIRGEALYGKYEGEATNPLRQFETDWLSANIFGIFNLNSLRFNQPVRKVNIYAGAGAGANYYTSTGITKRGVLNPIDSNNLDRFPDTTFIDREIAPHVGLMVGLAFRLGKRFNIGLEHQANVGLGRRSDFFDGVEKEGGVRTPFGDVLNYTSVRLNFNIGSSSKNSEPLYWINPLENILADVSDIKKKQDIALKDSDGDGVIDAIDQEPNTPPGAEVDTKGRVLDSDRDGVPNYRDKEPYNPPRSGEMVDSDGVVQGSRSNSGGGGGVTEDRVREIVQEELDKYNLTENAAGVADWFLPMIHFGTSSYAIKFSDYGTLAGIGRMLKSNPKLRLVVTGFTDQTGAQENNDLLSYQRAKSVIDHFVNNHGIAADRLVLQWKGQEDALVPSAASYMNRRVEFRVATADDVSMEAPTGESKKKEGY